MIAAAKTHGQLFATGGGHIRSDDYFKAMKVLLKKKKIKKMKLVEKNQYSQVIRQSQIQMGWIWKIPCFSTTTLKMMMGIKQISDKRGMKYLSAISYPQLLSGGCKMKKQNSTTTKMHIKLNVTASGRKVGVENL